MFANARSCHAYPYLDLMEEFAHGCLGYLLHIPLMRVAVYGLGLVFLVPMEFS